jgi:hypothetical protein
MRLPAVVLIETVVLAEAVPPEPVQFIVYVVVAVGVTLCDPAVAVEVVQGAEQVVALVADQVKVAAWPAAIVAGVALNVTLGLGATVTVVLAVAVPPAPVQVIVYVVVAVGLTLWEPDVAVDAVQGAEHAVALVADQVKVAAWPAASVVGAALKDTLGLGATVTVVLAVAVPPAPVQVIVYVVVAVGLTLWEPDVAVEVVQGAEQVVALVADQVKVAAWPAASVAGVALNVTLGLGGTVTVVLAEAVPPAPVQFIV